MNKGGFIRIEDRVYRVLDVRGGNEALLIDCKKKEMPKWIPVTGYEELIPETDTDSDSDKDCFTSEQVAVIHKRFSYIAGALPVIGDEKKRTKALHNASELYHVSIQTIRKYLCEYLAAGDISSLAPADRNRIDRELSKDEKIMRWALNKFYYTKNKNSVQTAYVMMLKERYSDPEGNLLDEYPSIHQFRYFYRKTKSFIKYSITRDGIKAYERNERPLTGDGVQEMAVSAGFGMMDATVCDIYLINEAGGVVGRPILTACVDAYSGLCLGYSLLWEGGVYSLTDLMLNVIADKKAHCRKFGIDSEGWKCSELPAVLITDMGSEYISANFEQIAELGVTIVNLPSYRPDLKGPVEQLFNVIQEEYKPYFKGKGVIEPDYQERGAHDYRKDACITMETFEKVIIRCILHYNLKRIVDFPFTERMLEDGIRPFAQDIYNWSKENHDCNLIITTEEKLVLILLPRCTGRFTRKGLIVNQMRYHCDGYEEEYLGGGEVTVSYNPMESGLVWIQKEGAFVRFRLIESRYRGKTVEQVREMKERQRAVLKEQEKTALQADIDLARHLEVLAEGEMFKSPPEGGKRLKTGKIKNIRANRERERVKTHKDHAKAVGIHA